MGASLVDSTVVTSCPFAVSLIGTVPASNYSAGPVSKIGGVVHVIVGSAGSAVAEFQRPGSQLSATYVIAGPGDRWPDGTLVQMLDNADVCYAQAAGNWPPTSYNAWEVAGYPTDPMTPAQLATLGRAMAWDAADRGYSVTTVVEPHGVSGICTHCNPDGSPDPAWGDHTCPGTIRLQQVKELLAVPPPPVGPPPSWTVEVDVQLTKVMITVQLDGNGHGWALLDGHDAAHPPVLFPNLTGVFANGADPRVAGYVPLLPPTANGVEGWTQIEAFGRANGSVDVWVVHAS